MSRSAFSTVPVLACFLLQQDRFHQLYIRRRRWRSCAGALGQGSARLMNQSHCTIPKPTSEQLSSPAEDKADACSYISLAASSTEVRLEQPCTLPRLLIDKTTDRPAG